MKKVCIFVFSVGLFSQIYAQETSVAIGTTDTKASAVLWLNSVQKNQGLIIPTVDSRNNIAAPGPEAGMIVYDLTDNSIFFYNGSIWIEAGGGDVLPITVDNVTLQNVGGTMSVKNGGITPEKIAPSNVEGQVLTTSGGAVSWTTPPTGGGSVTNVSANSPLTVTNPSTTPSISIPQANGTTNGFISSADWITFNNKLGSGSVAGGDLTGTLPNPIVAGIRGINVSATTPNINQVLQYNGTNWAPATLATGGTVTNVTGNAPISVTSSTTTPSISINQANGTTSGYISNTDWTTFNNKLGSGSVAGGDLSGTLPNPTVSRIQGISVSPTTPGTNQVLQYDGTNWTPATLATGGTVTNVTGNAPLSVTSSTTTPSISISQANGTTSGYLSNTDWNTFNSKLNGNILTSSGDLLFHDGSSTTRLPRGSNGEVLSSTGTGIQWSAPTGFANPMSSIGDIIVGGISGTPTSLSGGTGFLKSTGAALPAWSAVAGSDLDPAISINTTGSIAAGSFSSTSFSGAGTRMVIADPSGILGTQSIPSSFTTSNVIPKGDAAGLIASQLFDDGINVGIGTTNPNSTVDITATTPTLRLTSTGTISTDAASSIQFFNSITGLVGNIGDTGSSDHLQFASFGDGMFFNTVGSTRMTIDNDGFVGIGTTFPSVNIPVVTGSTKLEVHGNTILRPAIIGSAPYFGTSWFSMQHQDLPLNDRSYAFAQHKGGHTIINTPTNSGGNFIDFRVDDISQMTIYENGNVGIGNGVTPTAKLTVNGYTKLGNDAPAIKVKKFKSVTHANVGQSITIPHGLDVQKIISVQAMVEQDTDEFVPANYTLDTDYLFSWVLDATNIVIRNGGSATKIIGNNVTVLVTYEE